MARFQITPAADGAVTFEIADDQGLSAMKTDLSPQEAQDLVDLLGAVRQVTPGSVSAAPKEGVVQAVVDPAWAIPAVRAPQGRPMVIRHPGLGWLHFIFPDERAAEIAAALGAQLAPAPTPPRAMN